MTLFVFSESAAGKNDILKAVAEGASAYARSIIKNIESQRQRLTQCSRGICHVFCGVAKTGGDREKRREVILGDEVAPYFAAVRVSVR